MCAIAFKPLHSTLVMLAILGLVGADARPAHAAGTTGSACTTANQESIKLRTAHKLRQARDRAQDCAAATCSATVRAACKKRVAELTPGIPTVIFAVKDSAGSAVTDVRVSMDGDSIADHLDGTGISVDAGQHTFTFEASGHPSLDQPLLIMQGKKDRRETITLADPPPPPPPEVVASDATASSDASKGGGSGGLVRPLAFGLGGVGVASVIVGGVTGGLALSKWNSSTSECGSPTQCPNHAQSVSDHNGASSLATVSTITFVAGGVSLAAATLLFFLSPSRSEANATPGATSWRVSPSVGPGGGGMTVEGAF
jgi:hypothetical protein